MVAVEVNMFTFIRLPFFFFFLHSPGETLQIMRVCTYNAPLSQHNSKRNIINVKIKFTFINYYCGESRRGILSEVSPT